LIDEDIVVWIQGVKFNIAQLNCKLTYNLLLNNSDHRPTCIKKWAEHLPNIKMADDEVWQHIFYCPFKTTREVKLQSFQYKITNRIINTNKQLSIWKIKENALCNYCNNEDDLIHFFISCDNIRLFWQKLVKWWNNMEDLQINLLTYDIVENILFGYRLIDDIFKVINFVFLHAKYYIYISRLYNNNNLSLNEFLIILKQKLIMEKEICKSKGEVFEPFVEVLEYLS
jgi:hypothetical protein